MQDDVIEQHAYHELSAYTLSRGDPSFIHQYVVDAYAAQHASTESKPITIAFALIGLYLQVERHRSGKQVQEAHMRLAKKRRVWPPFNPPEERGAMTAVEVLQAEPGPERDQAIRAWSASVWEAWRDSHARVADLLRELGEL